MKKISDVNLKPKYYTKNKSKKNFILVKFEKVLSWIFVFAIFFGFIANSTNITAAPIQSDYFSYTINNALLAQVSDIDTTREALQKQLNELMKEIDEYKAEINKLSSKKRGVQSEISLLQTQIKKAEAEMRAIQLQINNLEKRADDTKRAILTTEQKMEKSKKFLKAALKYYYQL